MHVFRCYYFGQSLTDELTNDELTKAGGTPTPIGLIHTAWGGSTIEQVTATTVSTVLWSMDHRDPADDGRRIPG